jgi:tyrosine-protein kinase Etk/Wzc
MSTETERARAEADAGTTRGERKLTFVIDDDALFNGDKREHEGESGNFLELATALAQRKWFILKITAAATVLGLVVALLLPNRYTANTKILPPQQQQGSNAAFLSTMGSSGMGALASVAGKDLGLKNPSDLYIGLLKTRPVVNAIIQRFDLQRVYGVSDMTDAREKLTQATEIVSEKEGFINVSVQDGQRKRAAELANAYVEEMRNATKGMALTEASQRRLFYEQQLKQAKDDLANAEVALQQAQHKSGIVQLDVQAKTMIESAGKLRAEIAAKRVHLQALRSFATDQNADVEIARRELAQMQSELNSLENNKGQGSYEVALKDVPQAAVEYIRSFRELKFRETLFDILAKQYECARLDEAKNAPVIQVVEPAIEPERKSSPKRAVIVILCAVCAFFFACLITLLRKLAVMMEADPRRAQRLKAFRAAAFGK